MLACLTAPHSKNVTMVERRIWNMGVDASGKSVNYWQTLRDFWIGYFALAGATVEDYSTLRQIPIESARASRANGIGACGRLPCRIPAPDLIRRNPFASHAAVMQTTMLQSAPMLSSFAFFVADIEVCAAYL